MDRDKAYLLIIVIGVFALALSDAYTHKKAKTTATVLNETIVQLSKIANSSPQRRIESGFVLSHKGLMRGTEGTKGDRD